MISPYIQVGLTYFRRWQWWMVWVALAGYALLMVRSGVLARQDLFWPYPLEWMTRDKDFAALVGPVALVSILVALLAAMSSMHLREQTANWRGALVPAFVRPHLWIGAMVLSAAVFAIAWLFQWGMLLAPLGVLAVLCVVALTVAWCEHIQSLPAALGCVAAAFIFANQRPQAALGRMLLGQHNIVALFMILCSGAALGVMLWRLGRMREETSGWGGQIGPLGTFWSLDRRIRKVRNVSRADVWQRVRHWRLVTRARKMPWITAAAFAAFVSILPLLGGEKMHPKTLEVALVICAMAFQLLIPAVEADEGVWRRAGAELLLPASRIRFVSEVTLAVAIDWTEAWLAMTVASVLPIIIWAPHLIFDDDRGASIVWMIFLATAAAQLVVFGIHYNLPRLGWRWLGPMMRAGIMSVAAFAFIAFTMAIAQTGDIIGVIALAVWAILLAFCGMLLIGWGYVRWVSAEFA